MNEIFLLVGVDQDGDTMWNVYATEAEARADWPNYAEVAYAPVQLFRVDLTIPGLPSKRVEI